MNLKYVRPLFCWILIFSLFSSSLNAGVVDVTGKGLINLARVGALPTREFSQLGILSSKKLAEAGVAKVEMAVTEKQVAMIFLDSAGKETKRFFVNRATAQQLAPYRPSKFREWANKVKTNGGKIALAKARHFPMEASSFFVAIGALTVYDLVFNYHSNPLVAEQFLESQKDPISHVAFLAFMQANGLAVEPLMELVEKPWLRKYIPYLGMAVGMAASQMVHGVAHSELLKACAFSLKSDSVEKSNSKCDAAWSNFGTGWGPVVSEFSTSLITMFMSSVFSAAGSWVATALVEKSIQMLGMELLSFAIPGGGIGRAVRFLFNTGKNIQFLAWDAYLRAPIENYLANSGANQKIERLSECLGAHLSAQKRNKWQEATSFASDERFSTRHFCEGDFAQSAEVFFDLYREWRSANLKEAVTAQQAWFQYLSTLTSHYRTTQNFYQTLTDKIYKRMYKLSDKSRSPLDQILPLYGVAQEPSGTVDWTQYLEYPQELEKEQLLVTKYVSDQMLEDKKASDGLYQALTEKERKIFNQVQVALASSDPKVVGKGLEITARIYNRPPGILNPSHEYLTSETFKNGFKAILAMLGEPAPKMNAGQGFLAAWVRVEGKEESPFPKRLGNLLTPTVPEYMIASMAWGPDATSGQSLISKWGLSGFQAYFQPPRILRGDEIYPTARPLDDTIFNQKVWINSNPAACGSADRACYHTSYDWMRSGHLRPDILTPDGNNFANWWNQYVEPQYLNAWKSFELKYEQNVQLVADRLFSRKNHIANTTSIPNSPLYSLEQERNVALLILNTIYNSDMGNPAGESFLNRKFGILKDSLTLDYGSFSKLKEYQQEWTRARDLFRNLRVPLTTGANDKNADKYFISRLKDGDLKAAQVRLDEILQSIALELQNKVRNKTSSKLLQISLESLAGSHQELLDYSLIVNSASYVENNVLGAPTRRRCLDQLSNAQTSKNLFRGLDNNGDCKTSSDLVKSQN